MTDHLDQCPACKATDITRGRFFGRPPMGFEPAGLRFWTLKARPLPFTGGGKPRACTACGLVWVQVEPERLRRMLREAGTDETRRRFRGDGSGA